MAEWMTDTSDLWWLKPKREGPSGGEVLMRGMQFAQQAKQRELENSLALQNQALRLSEFGLREKEAEINLQGHMLKRKLMEQQFEDEQHDRQIDADFLPRLKEAQSDQTGEALRALAIPAYRNPQRSIAYESMIANALRIRSGSTANLLKATELNEAVETLGKVDPQWRGPLRQLIKQDGTLEEGFYELQQQALTETGKRVSSEKLATFEAQEKAREARYIAIEEVRNRGRALIRSGRAPNKDTFLRQVSADIRKTNPEIAERDAMSMAAELWDTHIEGTVDAKDVDPYAMALKDVQGEIDKMTVDLAKTPPKKNWGIFEDDRAIKLKALEGQKQRLTQKIQERVPTAPLDPAQREVGKTYRLPKGMFKWTAEGWEAVAP